MSDGEPGDDTDAGGSAGTDADDAGGAYGGVLGAVPFAWRHSDSWVFRSYVAVGGLVAAATTAIVALGLVSLLGQTAAAAGGTFTFSRALYLLVGLAVVAPLLAPLLLVARAHRLGHGRPGYDRALGAAGYLVVLALYVALVMTTPPELQERVRGPLAGVVRALYRADPALAGVPLALAAGAVWAVHRRYR
jgi:hypothetical protein